MSNRKEIQIGQKFNRLTVISNGIFKNTRYHCICKCDCGNITNPISEDSLKTGNTKSCGCLQKEKVNLIGKANKNNTYTRGKKYCASLVGKTIGRLLIISLDCPFKDRHERYFCQCSCGNTTTAGRSALLSGNTKSCGCLRKEHIKKIKKEYRLSKGRNPNILLTPIQVLVRVKLKKLHMQIKIRDNFTCGLCGKSGGVLHTHHIVPFHDNTELQNKENNLITLCKNCHKIKAHGNNMYYIDPIIQEYLLKLIEQKYDYV